MLQPLTFQGNSDAAGRAEEAKLALHVETHYLACGDVTGQKRKE